MELHNVNRILEVGKKMTREGIEVKVTPFYLGLGYPVGYRSLDQILAVAVGEKIYEVDVYTVTFHKERHFFEKEYYEKNCRICGRSFNKFWTKNSKDPILEEFREVKIDKVFAVYTDLPELTFENIEWLVRNFVINLMPEVNPRVVWNWMSGEEELKHWQEDHDKWLQWLKKGAPPYSISVAPNALDNLSEEQRQEWQEAMVKFGFEKKDDGTLHKKAEEIKEDLLAEAVERRLLKIADEEKEDGEVYLSPASWPFQGLVRAGGKRYLISDFNEDNPKERCWVGYLRNKKILVLFESKGEGRKRLKLCAEPDFLEAMTLVYKPR